MTRKSGLGQWHGSASDRGSADRYYGRECKPHFWPQGTGVGKDVKWSDMSADEIAAYVLAWQTETDRKDYGGANPDFVEEHDDDDIEFYL